ncbi:MAG: shikimate dehydrogenase [Selenomonadaceae bacterium]|nr:shikimate dehydrogenase [Selenomonadaceae bacterium]MBR6888438.1 shikimate dehydrogenase [Selenomonadaceae bacterium]
MISTEIKNFGILGYPVGHSLSPQMYKAAFEAAGFVNYNYIPLQVHAGKLFMAVEAIKGLEFRGVNVTIPHKMTIARYLDAIDADALVIGAVNTVVNDGGMLTGYNTDVAGFLSALAEANFLPEDCHAVILGAGGAARAILWGLCKKRAEFITIGARNLQKANALAKDFMTQGQVEAFDWNSDEFKEMLQTADILINTTPLGMFPHVDDMPPVDLKLLPEGALVYDIIYNPAETKLLQTAKELGYPTLNGLSMLLLQGKEAYRLYTGETPDMEVMAATLKKNLAMK